MLLVMPVLGVVGWRVGAHYGVGFALVGMVVGILLTGLATGLLMLPFVLIALISECLPHKTSIDSQHHRAQVKLVTSDDEDLGDEDSSSSTP